MIGAGEFCGDVVMCLELLHDKVSTATEASWHDCALRLGNM